MQVAEKRLDAGAVPGPERYAVAGRLCRPCCERRVADAGGAVVVGERGVLVDKQVLALPAEVARRHGFPRMRVTVEVLEDA